MSLRLIAEGLGCRRGERRLFAGLSFILDAGEALVITGANGAGKSSLLRILAGLLAPSEGEVRLEGVEERAEAAHCLGHRDGAKAALTVLETARFDRALLGGAGAVEAALERVGLEESADLPCGALSAGQRRRLALARLLTCPRRLWLLDEPIAALDSGGRKLVEDLIAEHRAGGGIVAVATHQPIAAASARRLLIGAGA